jgi:hypothetical protein
MIKRNRPLYKSDAEECRQRGFEVGDRLVGDEGYGPTVIELTAVGERAILAKRISHAGKPCCLDETMWTLSCRDWEKIEPPAQDQQGRKA